MSSFCFILILLFLFPSTIFANKDDWYIIKSTHFIVYYKNTPKDFIEKIVEKSEDYYHKIADELGFKRYDFWLWENRAKIYVYDNIQDYQKATGHPEWSMGSVIPKEKTIHIFPYANQLFETILPHEMGHIIFREFVGFDNPIIPLWLDEGVACYQEAFRRPMADRIIREAISKNESVSLVTLSNIDLNLVKEPKVVNLFYAASISVLDYLIKEFGKDKFFFFCQVLRDKKDFNRALSSVYRFKDIKELDISWQKYLKR